MIDKPKGKGEQLLEGLFKWCRNKLNILEKKLENPKRIINDKKAIHPLLTKIVTATCCVAVCGLIVVGYSTPRQVTVQIDDSITTTSTVYETTAKRVDDFLKIHEIDFDYGQDIIDVEGHDSIKDGMIIHISKAFKIYVIADGQTSEMTVLPTTTKEVLDELNISVGENDIVEPAADCQLADGDKIIVKRVTKEIVKERRTLDFETVTQVDGTIAIGDMQVTQKGRKGKEERTYEVTYIDGEEADKVLIEKEVLKKPRNKIIGYGTKISFGKPAGLNYTKKFTNVKAVSYYFKGNPKGSYGLPCKYGTVAVDRNLIPLGTKLYIEGYGYAIANDVGSAIKGKTVDLYMESYNQCMIWGARRTTVYVLD